MKPLATNGSVRLEIGWTAHWENSLKEIDEKIALLSGGISSYGLHPWRRTKSSDTVSRGVG
jgi:hypothetical protein